MPGTNLQSPAPDVGAEFEQFYRAHREQVFATCLRLSGDRVRATEWMQDVFVRIWERWHTLEDRADASGWVHRVTLHTVFNIRRGDRRRLARVALAEDVSPTASGIAEGSASPFVTPPPVRRMALERAMSTLKGRPREVFVLHDVEGHSTEDIAALLRVAPRRRWSDGARTTRPIHGPSSPHAPSIVTRCVVVSSGRCVSHSSSGRSSPFRSASLPRRGFVPSRGSSPSSPGD